MGYSLARGSSGYKQSRAHYFVRFHPPPNAPLFSHPPILPPSFTPTVASSSLSFPLYRHRRGGPALIYLHPRARRRRRGVFIFYPASTRCKVYRRDLHRLAFCFPSSRRVLLSCSCTRVAYLCEQELSRSMFTRYFFFFFLMRAIQLCYRKIKQVFISISILLIAS